MASDNFCHCGTCGHEKIDECYTKQCTCCLTDHQGPFGKNRWLKQILGIKLTNWILRNRITVRFFKYE